MLWDNIPKKAMTIFKYMVKAYTHPMFMCQTEQFDQLKIKVRTLICLSFAYNYSTHSNITKNSLTILRVNQSKRKNIVFNSFEGKWRTDVNSLERAKRGNIKKYF